MSNARWNRAHALAILIGLGSLIALHRLYPLLLAGILSFLVYLWKNRVRLGQFKPYGGYANWVTLARLALLLYAGTKYQDWHPYWSFTAFLAVIVSDGFDGYLARRFGQQSKIGEMLDVETDALMSALLAAIHYLQGAAGWWLLLAGSLRYWYVLALYWNRLENVEADLPSYTRLVGVLFISGLLGPFVLPEWLAKPGLAIGSSLVTLSFLQSYRSCQIAKRSET